jgi:hypothetical protein
MDFPLNPLVAQPFALCTCVCAASRCIFPPSHCALHTCSAATVNFLSATVERIALFLFLCAAFLRVDAWVVLKHELWRSCPNTVDLKRILAGGGSLICNGRGGESAHSPLLWLGACRLLCFPFFPLLCFRLRACPTHAHSSQSLLHRHPPLPRQCACPGFALCCRTRCLSCPPLSL